MAMRYDADARVRFRKWKLVVLCNEPYRTMSCVCAIAQEYNTAR
jgi:hypothetical protein